MSKVRLYFILAILTLLAQASLLSAENTFVETTYTDPNWVLVISDMILRANTCVASDGQTWYENVFNPCYDYNRYWKLAPGASTGRASPMSLIGTGSLDSFYVLEGFGFQLYDDATGEPCSPYLGGAKYVSLTEWRDTYPAPDGFEPGTFFVLGTEGDLKDYSIIVCRYPLRLHKTHNAPPSGVGQEDYVTYEISYENQPEGLSDPTDPNSGPQNTNNVIITDFLPLEMDFNSASNGGVYNPRLHTVTWDIGNLSIGDSGSVQLNVRVNRFAEQGGIITNYSEIASGSLCAAAAVDIDVLNKPSLFYLEKIDVNEPNSVLPDDCITYEITYGPGGVDHDNVRIVDYLANEVDFNSASGNGVYDPNFHIVTWNIGELDSGDPLESVTLTVKVNELAEPNGVIINHCKIESDSSYTATTTETSVSPWQPDPPVIYVDNLAKRGSNNGMSWANAYLDLQDALQRAGDGYGSEIWVAEGTYYTHTDPDAAYWDVSFELIDGVGIYGGFAGNETFRSQRDWLANETILEGNIPGGSSDSDTFWIITAVDCNSSTIVDGFTIKNGSLSVIKIDSSSPTIRNSIITFAYEDDGIECTNQSSPNITKCKIYNNSSGSGIKIGEGGGYPSNPTISYCLIMNNGNGISDYSSNDGSSPVITNNWICGNDYYGIHLVSTSDDIVFRNNTVANNAVGIRMDSYADITNCIVWGNNPSLFWSSGNEVSYSCVQGGYTGTGNIADDPCFVNDADDNYHLNPDSPCIDKGNTNLIIDSNETDIDGESRVFDGDANGTDLVDMGADEFYWSPADFDRDELVNFLDYALLASVWLANDPNISLDYDNDVDVYDLGLFCEDWLWQSAWNQSDPLMKMMGFGFGGGDGLLYAVASPEQPQPQELSEEQYLEETKKTIEIVESFRSQISDDEQMEQEYEEAWQETLDIIDDWLKELEDQL